MAIYVPSCVPLSDTEVWSGCCSIDIASTRDMLASDFGAILCGDAK